MGDRAEEWFSVLRLAVERGFLTEAQAKRWMAELGALPQGEVSAGWLVEQGALTAEQLEELRAGAKTVHHVCDDTITLGAAAQPPALPVIPGYDVIGVLGRGGMSTVYTAWQRKPRRLVAVKVLTAGGLATEAERRRFEREAQAVADLSHPAIVAVHEFGEVAGQPFFSMEFVGGIPLDTFVADRDLSVQDRCLLMLRVCEAVGHAHQRGVVHRDLKPANILVDVEGSPKVLDFGLAKIQEPARREKERTLTRSGQVLGTPLYMAPEQTLGRPGEIDARSDVYALGVIFYQLLTGRLPHEPGLEPPTELARRIREELPKRPGRLNRLVDSQLEAVVLRALEKRKDDRYPTAQALAEDIGRYLRGERVVGAPASGVRWVGYVAGRLRAAILPVVATALVSLAVGVAIGFYLLRVTGGSPLQPSGRAGGLLGPVGVGPWILVGAGVILAGAGLLGRVRRRGGAARDAGEGRREAAQALEELNRARREVEQESYVLNIVLAEERIKQWDLQEAMDILERCPARLRHWEWWRLRYLCSLYQQAPETREGGERDRRILHAPGLTCLAFSPCGTRIAVGKGDGTVALYGVETQEETLALRGHESAVRCVSFGADGGTIAAAAADGAVRLWDAATGSELVRRGMVLPSGDAERRGSAALAVAFGLGGRKLVSVCADGSVRATDPQSGQEVGIHEMGLTETTCAALGPDADGYLVAAAAADDAWVAWSSRTNWEHKHKHAGGRRITSLAVGPTGSLLASGTQEGVEVRDLAAGRLLTLRAAGAICLAFSPDGKRLATAHRTVRLWDLQVGRETIVLEGHGGSDIVCLAFSLDGHRIASADAKGDVVVWDSGPRVTI